MGNTKDEMSALKKLKWDNLINLKGDFDLGIEMFIYKEIVTIIPLQIKNNKPDKKKKKRMAN